MAKKILGFTIDVVGTSENKQKIGELTQEIQKLADIKSKLDEKIKSGESLSKNEELQYGKTTAAIKYLSGEKNKLITTQTNELKSINAVDKSYNSLVAQNAKLSQQLRALADPLGKDKDQFDKLSGSIKKNTDTLKEMDEAMGRSFRNVGDYAGGILKASNEMGLFGQAGAKVQQAMKSMQDGLNVVKAGFGSLRGAIISTGIGALAIALSSIVSYLTSTKEGAEKLERVMAAIGATFDVVIGRLATFGKSLIEVFTSPRKAIQDFQEWFDEKVLSRLKGFGTILEGIKTFDFGKIKSGFGEVGDGIKSMANELTGSLDSFWSGLATQIGVAITATDKLTLSNQKLRDEERALNVERSKSLSKIKELEAIGKDTDKAIDERIAATQKAFDIEKGIMNKDVQLAQRKLNNLRKEGEIKGELLQSAEHLDKVAQAEIELNNKKEQSLGRQIQLHNDLNQLEKEKIKQTEDLIKQYGKMEQSTDNALTSNMTLTQAQIDNAKLAADKIIEEEERKRDAAIEAEQEKQEAIKELKLAVGQEIANSIAKIEDEISIKEKEEIQSRYDSAVKTLDAKLKNGIISQKQYDKQLYALNKKKFEQEKQNAISTIAIQAAIGVITALATQNYAGAITIGIAAATEAAIVRSQKYARGGFVHGAGSGTSDSINARLSNGEFVMNAKSTAAFAPILNAMNMAGGGRNSFAQGGIVSPVSSSGISGSIVSAQSQMNFDMLALRIVSGINDKKVYLKEADVTTSQKTVSTILASSKF